MSLIPQEKTEHEQEESGPVGGKRGGDSFGPEKDPKGYDTQEDSGPVGGNKGGGDGMMDIRTLNYDQEENGPSRESKSGRVDEITP